MAIQLINSTFIKNDDLEDVTSIPFNVTNGTNRFLVLCISTVSAYGGLEPASDGVLWYGQAMTRATSNIGRDYGNTEIWYLKNPTVLNDCFTIQWGGEITTKKIQAMYFTGVDDINLLNPFNTGGSASNDVDNDIETDFNNSMVIDAWCHGNDNSWHPDGTLGVGQTIVGDYTGNGSLYGASSYKLTTTPGTINMMWDGTGGPANYAHCIVELKVASNVIGPFPTHFNA